MSPHTFEGSSPASSGVVPGSASGRATLASKSHVQLTSGTGVQAQIDAAAKSATRALMVCIYSMKAGVWNLGFGLLALVLGLTGKFSLIGTSSPYLLAVAGGALATWGVVQMLRSKRQ